MLIKTQSLDEYIFFSKLDTLIKISCIISYRFLFYISIIKCSNILLSLQYKWKKTLFLSDIFEPLNFNSNYLKKDTLLIKSVKTQFSQLNFNINSVS